MCTGISVTSTEGQEYFGRTQEYDIDYDYVLAQFPRKFEVLTPIGHWQTSYSVMGVGTMVSGQLAPMVLDGINEHGLVASTQYFADEFIYSSIKEIRAAGKTPIYAEQFIFYLLSTCQTIQDVKERLEQVAIPNESLVMEGGLPQHFFVKDLTGQGIVVEPSVALGFKVFDNPVGVMTNSPSFDWHLTNLRNYTGISSHNQKELALNAYHVPSFGKGSGLLGMPGDYTAPSRFIRAAMLLNLSQPVDSSQAINLGFHILSTSDIPKGVIDVNSSLQYTQYTVMYDQGKRELYIKLYENLAIQKLTFCDSEVNASAPKISQLIKTSQYVSLNE